MVLRQDGQRIPSYQKTRRRGSKGQPAAYASSGGGRWILLTNEPKRRGHVDHRVLLRMAEGSEQGLRRPESVLSASMRCARVLDNHSSPREGVFLTNPP